NDTGSVATRRGVGVDALLFATDYPHSEGTFPFSKDVVDRMIAEHPDATTEDFVAILGGNAAKLFKRANLQPQVDARVKEMAGV
ncbi:MAG: amidohydrolase family protein, partial [Acidimicrobiia bacterium]